MGVRLPSVQSTTVVNALPATAAETIVCVSPPISPALDAAALLILWSFFVVVGAGTTSLFVRIRRGTTLAAPLLFAGANQQQTVVAGNSVIVSGSYFDTPGIVGGQQYALTIAQTAATAGGTFLDPCLIVMAL